MYDTETWAVKKAREYKLEIAEMVMLPPWMCGVAKHGRIRTERIRGQLKKGNSQRMYGHMGFEMNEYE